MNAPPQVTLITPTKDRPVAFSLCERWMSRQSYKGRMQWIVCDDGTEPVQCNLGQEHLKRPHSEDKTESFLGNLLAGLDEARGQFVLFIEDDDWYAEDYIERMVHALRGVAITGQANARYYCLKSRRYRICGNTGHASLAQTGIRADLIPRLRYSIRRRYSVFVDIHLWKELARQCNKILDPTTTLHVGMKSLPGTGGIGIGHRLGGGNQRDDSGEVLKGWIGSDAQTIEEHLENYGNRLNS